MPKNKQNSHRGTASLTIGNAAPNVKRHALLSTSALAGGAMRGFAIATGFVASASLFLNPAIAQDFIDGGALPPTVDPGVGSVGIGPGATGTGPASIYIGYGCSAVRF